MKKIILSLFILCLLIPGIVQAKSSQTALLINDTYITTGAPPIILNGTTYIPLRNLFESIDFTVVYYPEYKAAVAWYSKGNFKLAFTIGSNHVEIDTTYIDVKSAVVKISGKPILKNGSVYVPLRAFGELFGANVKYDKYIDTVLFTSSVDGIKQKIYPLVGLSLTEPRDNPNSGVTTVVEKDDSSSEKQVFSAKEIAKLMDRVGIVLVYDFNNDELLGSGSGFMIEDGFFITNSHVGQNNKLLVKLDGKVYDNKGVYWFDNEDSDIYGTVLSTEYKEENGRYRAVGELPEKRLKYNTKLPEIGDKVYAIGSPLGLENSISEGIVSGIRDDDGITKIQHTADIDHGSSGGALLNEYGEVIGVTSSGVEGSNLEFAIPISYVVAEIDKLTTP